MDRIKTLGSFFCQEEHLDPPQLETLVLDL